MESKKRKIIDVSTTGDEKKSRKDFDCLPKDYQKCSETKMGNTIRPWTVGDLQKQIMAANKENKMALITMGDKKEDWVPGVDFNEEIIMLNCKNLYEDQMKTSEEDMLDDLTELMETLQNEIGISPRLAVQNFTNWGKTQEARVMSCSPKDMKEMQILIKAAAQLGVGLRCAGSTHSWSPMFSDSGNILVYVDKMKSDYKDGTKIRFSNRNNAEVDIMTGVTTGDFQKFQLENKVNIPANVILEVVQMVSVVATGCHGVGRDFKAPSDHVVKMRIFDSTGQLRTYSSADKEMLKAISANLGCFGIIFDMTLKLVPEIIVSTENRYYKLKDLFYNASSMKELLEKNSSVELFWFPYNSVSHFCYNPKRDDVWVRVINKENGKVEGKSYYIWKDAKDYLSQEGLAVISPFIAKHPAITPFYSWAAFKTLKKILYPPGKIYQELPHAVHFRKYIHKAPVYDMEFAFDLKGDYSRLLKIVQVVVDKVDHEENQGEYPLNIALEMRLMGYSDSFLCPAIIGNPEYGGSGHVLYIEVLSVVGTKGWEEFCTDVGKEWMQMGGVPHLAKQWSFLPDIDNHFRKVFGKHMERFKEQLRKSEADPNGMFLNESLKRLLQFTPANC